MRVLPKAGESGIYSAVGPGPCFQIPQLPDPALCYFALSFVTQALRVSVSSRAKWKVITVLISQPKQKG